MGGYPQWTSWIGRSIVAFMSSREERNPGERQNNEMGSMSQMNRFGRGAIALLALSLALVVSACRADDSLSEKPPSTPESTTTTTDRTTTTLPAVGGDTTAAPVVEFDRGVCPASFTEIPQTGVALPLPGGFYVADTFTGIFHDASLASVVVVELPVRISDETSTIDYLERLETEQGVDITERYSAEVAGYPATLVRAWQLVQGIRMERWLAIAESGASTLMITAQLPASEPPEKLDELREVVLCAAWAPGTLHEFSDGPPFTIDPVQPFGEEQHFSGGVIFDGGDGALFVAAPSIAPPQGDRRDVVLSLFAMLGPQGGGPLDAEPVVTAGPEPMTIDGFNGLRLDGEGSIDGEAFIIFQVVLFGEAVGYWRMAALIPADRADELLPAAEEMARSFRRD